MDVIVGPYYKGIDDFWGSILGVPCDRKPAGKHLHQPLLDIRPVVQVSLS